MLSPRTAVPLMVGVTSPEAFVVLPTAVFLHPPNIEISALSPDADSRPHVSMLTCALRNVFPVPQSKKHSMDWWTNSHTRTKHSYSMSSVICIYITFVPRPVSIIFTGRVHTDTPVPWAPSPVIKCCHMIITASILVNRITGRLEVNIRFCA
jgi:hypothetical protein